MVLALKAAWGVGGSPEDNKIDTRMPDGTRRKRASAATPQTVSAVLDRDGFLCAVYRGCWNDLCRYIRKTFGSSPPDPEDVAQTAFTKFAALDDLHGVRNPKAFLITTARNIVLDHHRIEKARRGHFRQIADDGTTINADLDDLTPERVLLGKTES